MFFLFTNQVCWQIHLLLSEIKLLRLGRMSCPQRTTRWSYREESVIPSNVGELFFPRLARSFLVIPQLLCREEFLCSSSKGPWASLESTCTHFLSHSQNNAHTHTHTHTVGVTTTALTWWTLLMTSLSHYCCKPPGRPRAHPARMMAKRKTPVMTKRCCVSAEWPRQHCSGVAAQVRGCRWRWGQWHRWFHRCGPVWQGPAPAASPSASPPWRQRCPAPHTECSLHILWGRQTRQGLSIWTIKH